MIHHQQQTERVAENVGFSMALGGSASLRMLPLDKDPARATLNAESTRHGARPGPEIAPECTRGALACPAAERREKTPAAGKKSNPPMSPENKRSAYARETPPSLAATILPSKFFRSHSPAFGCSIDFVLSCFIIFT